MYAAVVFASERNTAHSHSLADLVLAFRVLDPVHAISNCQTHPLGCASFDLKNNLRFAASAGTTAGAGLVNDTDTATTTTTAVSTVAKTDTGTAALASVCEVSLVHLVHHSFVQSARTIRNHAKRTLVIRGTQCPATRCVYA